MPEVVRNVVVHAVMDSAIGFIKFPNFFVHDNDNWTCNNSEMERKKTWANKRLKCRCPRQQQLNI